MEAQKKKERTKAVGEATKVLAKVVTPLATLEAMLASESARGVPQANLKAARVAQTTLDNMRKVALQVTTDGSLTTLPITLDEVKAATDAAQLHSKNLAGMIDAVKRFSAASAVV